MQPDQQQRIMGYFIEEAKDHLNTIEQGLLNLQSTIEDPEMINEVFRAAHSVKGGAAMLGLNGIQRVSHRLEDFFKVLKESPIRVDQKLENLFLRAFDALQELLGQLQGPFGLTEDAANQIIAGVEPTFGELEQHLNQLAGVVGDSLQSTIPVASGFDLDTPRPGQLEEALEQLFRQDVPLRLREMLQLFKQPEHDLVSRQQLQELCRSLGSLGEQYQLHTWCYLVDTARRAIAHPDNPYRVLAPIVIRDIKLAQELILAGRSAEITPCTQLQDLVPVAAAPFETVIQDDFADLLAADITAPDALVDDQSLELSFEDLAGHADSLDLTGEFDTELTAENLGIRQGPEVGMAELNSLADLFEGEMPDLGLTWQQEEVLPDGAELSTAGIDLDNPSDRGDFSDLLFEEEVATATESADDDFNNLFGDDLDDDTPTQAASFPPSVESALDAGLDDFADLLEIADTEPATTSTNLNLDADLDLGLDLDAIASPSTTADNAPGLDLETANLLGVDSTADFPLDSTAEEPDLDNMLGDLGDLFDGLAEADLGSTPLAEEIVPTTPEADWNLPSSVSRDHLLPELTDVHQVDSDAESGHPSPLDFNFDDLSFDDLAGIAPIDSPEAGAALFDDLNLDNLADKPPAEPELFMLDESSANPISIPDPWGEELDTSLAGLDLNDAGLDLSFDGTSLDDTSLEDSSLNSADLDAMLATDEHPTEPALEFTNAELVSDDQAFDDLFGQDATPDLTTWFQSSEEEDGTLQLDDLPLNDLLLNDLPLAEVLSTDADSTSASLELSLTPEPESGESSRDSLDLDDLLGTTVQEENDLFGEALLFEDADADSVTDVSAVSELTDVNELTDLDGASLADLLASDDADLGVTHSTTSDENEANGFTQLSDREPELTFDAEDWLMSGASDNDVNDPTIAADLATDLDLLGVNDLDWSEDNLLASDESLFIASDLEPADVSTNAVTDTPTDFDALLNSDTSSDLWGDTAALGDLDFESFNQDNATLNDREPSNAAIADFSNMSDMDDLLGDAADASSASIDLSGMDDLLGDTAADPAIADFSNMSDMDDLLGDASDASVNFSNMDDLLSDTNTIGEANPVGDFDELDHLLDEPAPLTDVTSSSEFGNLEELLDQDPVNSFADLDGLLDDATASMANETAVPNSFLEEPLHSTSVAAELDDFSDLESLLSSDGLDEETPSAPTSGFNDSEFDDLNNLLKDAEEKMGGSPTVKLGSGLTQARRSTRPGRVFSEQTMRVPVKHLDNLSNLVGELVVNRNSLEQDQERLRQSLDNLLYQVQQLSDVGQRMQDLYERSLLESSLLASRHGYRNSPLSARPSDTTVVELDQGHHTGIEYDPLEMDRFTGFHSLSQEMIELIVRVRESSSDIEFIVDETEQVTRMFRQVTTQLQEGLTRSRMVPFAQTADRLPRAVRDISMKVGKQAELVVEGRETLIDKMILEQLYDPMTHLVNNAITHGIESPAIRAAAGKPAAGRITIRAFHQGNQTIISVSDDGAGIDVERVKAKAVEKGLLSQAEARSLSRLDVYDILFHPGFSTKDQADDFSGRGVGMDVVRTSLSEIRGVINTDSNPGKGTTFTIRLPLTLSISKALCCISDRARIAFPMDGVEDMLDVPKERIQTNGDGQPCIAWRDTILPVRPLPELLGYNRHLSRGNVYGGNQEDDMISIVVLRSAGNFLALQVDQVMGEQEIVIKQLEGPVPKPVGVAGATVLGDGRIMPIADVLELIDLSMGRIRRDAGGSLWEQGGVTPPPEATTVKTEPMVLIVDDSITVRELLSMTFNKVGYRVEQARDGQEAWEKLRSGLPCDIVFCDIEMPRMDGLELLSRIQKDINLKHLPIAMLTSRGADRHRQMAASLGASGYFTKPYLEEALLDAAQRMLKGERLLTS
ncbi:MAG: response regulator [Leptolyngbyaceae cyanobacterium bins.349]|nr:response regulator [Leptolyngbyaceae cyanobacterium bins.349]